MRLFKRKPRVTYLGEKPQGTCIILSNHSAASGPVTHELYFPDNMRMWGTYEMCFGMKMRREYLRDTYFQKKKGFSKSAARFCTAFAAPFMALFYKGMQMLPTYPDARLKNTVDESVELLRGGIDVIIFPEDSSDGYHDVLKNFFGGFWLLAKRYHETTGEDIQIVDLYYHRKTNQIVVAEPKSYLELAAKYSRREATEFFLNDMNSIYLEHILPNIKTKKTKKKNSEIDK